MARQTKDELIAWLVSWFGERGQVPSGSREEQVGLNYFDAGLIDSFGVIELISDIERECGVEFSSEDFLDRRFSSIGGLADVLVEKMGAE